MNQLSAPPTPARPLVNTFDIFDTLIARRCITPDGVFARVEREQAMPGFAALRWAAEAALAGTAYGLVEIYRRLASMAELTPARESALLAAELAAEHAESVPIAENLARVRDGDLLVSDMYLDPGSVRGLLERAGLARQVGLLVTNAGKSSGRIWPLLLEQITIERHLGDHLHSDVAMPSRLGIAAEHSAVAAPTGVEDWLLGVGLGDLGRLLREARLRSWHPDPVARRLQLIQIQLNAPILLLSSILLHRLARRLGAHRLLFASRDCDLWLTLFRALAFEDSPASEYFYTSRRARTTASPAYCAYAADRLGEDALLVDLCGTGWSAALLLQSLGLRRRNCFYIHQLAPVPLYENRAVTPDTCIIHTAVPPEAAAVDHIGLEMANYAEHGSIVDIRHVAGAMLPVLAADGRSAGELQLVAAQRQGFAAVVNLVRQAPPLTAAGLDDDTLAAAITEFYRLLSRETVLTAAFGASHHAEDIHTLKSLDLIR